MKRQIPIPSDALSQHIGIVGKTGSGKTNTAKVLVEHHVAAGTRVCILDPIKSDWWGMTSSASGKSAGLPFHILGGPKGHVPLGPKSGAVVGELVGSGRMPLSIIDMVELSPREHSHWYTEFAESLFRHMKGVLVLVLEEADIFAPKERLGSDGENMRLYWSSKIARAGRSKGIRLVVSCQRTQKLHNDLLGSCDTLVAHRLAAPADRKPVIEWLKVNLDADQVKTIDRSLATLQKGQAWVCYPEGGVVRQEAFPLTSTFDNSKTPAADAAHVDVTMAPVDLGMLRKQLADAVQEIEANDPKLLRAEVARLRRDLEKALKTPVTMHPGNVEKQIADGVGIGMRKMVESASGMLQQLHEGTIRLQEISTFISSQAATIRDHFTSPGRYVPDAFPAAHAAPGSNRTPPPHRDATSPARRPTTPQERPTPVLNGRVHNVTGGPTPRQQRFLDAAATLTCLQAEVTRETVCGWIGVHPRGGSVGEELGALEAAGLITMVRGYITVTPAGMGAACTTASYDAVAAARAGLSPRQARVFDIVVAAWPDSMARDDIAKIMNIHPRGGSFGEDIARLVGRGLATSERGRVRARDFIMAGKKGR